MRSSQSNSAAIERRFFYLAICAAAPLHKRRPLLIIALREPCGL